MYIYTCNIYIGNGELKLIDNIQSQLEQNKYERKKNDLCMLSWHSEKKNELIADEKITPIFFFLKI